MQTKPIASFNHCSFCRLEAQPAQKEKTPTIKLFFAVEEYMSKGSSGVRLPFDMFDDLGGNISVTVDENEYTKIKHLLAPGAKYSLEVALGTYSPGNSPTAYTTYKFINLERLATAS